ncbi:hypothetical protein ACFFX0_23530 [Citricoccus parietis]|uniref:Uncharacterized protein n=1 Tax=Citricoccus parietis TaxID=592307 RepID=A0ABV5G514_9MICC
MRAPARRRTRGRAEPRWPGSGPPPTARSCPTGRSGDHRPRVLLRYGGDTDGQVRHRLRQ